MTAAARPPLPATAAPSLSVAAAPEPAPAGPGLLAGARAVAGEAAQLARDLTDVLRGTDRIAPSPKDRRFADEAWRSSPTYRRVGQAHVAGAACLDRLVDRYEAAGADWQDVERARFAVKALSSALAPTNTLLGNPAAVKRMVETGGRSALRGLGQFLSDVRHNGGMPTQTDRSAFAVGRDLAVTPGSVVYRDDVIELIQYQPVTEQVHARPLLVVPPPIGRYYFLDLRPGRSFVEHAVANGLQVFLISWRNPTKKQADWNLDTYAERVRRALAVAKQVTGSPDVNTIGFCAGGIVTTTVLAHLAAMGDQSVHTASYGVTMLDFDQQAQIGAFSGAGALGLARWVSGRRGVLDARALGAVFSWMRPDDLVFNYVVNQWLMGEKPPAFDVLAWNADGTNLPAALHRQFLQIFGENALTRPGTVSVLGTPVDLAEITVPTYVVGALTDHITPWAACYRTTQLLSGPSTFVLSNSGHIQSLVNPPGNPKASYWTGGAPGPDPEDWRAGAEKHTGSWWEHWADWVAARSGPLVDAPATQGSDRHPARQAAPGSYVIDQVPA